MRGRIGESEPDGGRAGRAVIVLHDLWAVTGLDEVTCVLPDNGAGMSTFIRIPAGARDCTSGELLVNGKPRHFASPRDASDEGIATVCQDLAVVGLMPVLRVF